DWEGELIGVGTEIYLPHRGYPPRARPAEFDVLTWLEVELPTLSPAVGAKNPPPADQTVGTEPAFYLFTSGTTGLPKASTMSHYRWNRALAGFGLSGVRLKRDDVLMSHLPMYHNNALTVGLGCVLAAGACLAVEEHFSASRFWDQAR